MTLYTYTETGKLIMRDGKAFGVIYEDGRETNYGWMDPAKAKLGVGLHLHKRAAEPPDPEDPRYIPCAKELLEAEIVEVKRTIIMETLT